MKMKSGKMVDINSWRNKTGLDLSKDVKALAVEVESLRDALRRIKGLSMLAGIAGVCEDYLQDSESKIKIKGLE